MLVGRSLSPLRRVQASPVSRARIQSRPKADYERLLDTLSHDPDPYSGYFMGWMWSELFQGHQELCPMPPKMAAISHPMAMDELAQRFPEAVKRHYASIALAQAQTAVRRSLQSGVSGGISGGVSGGVSEGVSGGVSGGVPGGVSATTMAPGSITVTKVKGTMALDVPNCTACTQREGAIGAVVAGIANATGVDAKSVKATLTCSRRLTSDGLFVHRLEAVNGAYEITIPAGTTITAESVKTAIMTTGSACLTSKFAAAMTAAGITDIVVKVISISTPTVETTVTDAPATTTAAPKKQESSARQFFTGPMAAILALSMAALA
ncbi:unnamed protein product [Polarella glacialis]|uniref:Uncharacterized protein n=1 Tax=Polarella glacialis TaxID=89957 RepID=A0A813J4D6_POLGL|nr:unnamed protein product [Polarella glacialis]